MKQKTAARTAAMVAHQPARRPALPCIYGPVEFREYRARLEAIDRMLAEGGIECAFIRLALAENAAEWAGASGKELGNFARQSVLALRCNVARVPTGQSFRGFAVRAAESSLPQWFLRVSEVDIIGVPGKSALERFSKWVSGETMTQIHLKLATQAVTPAGPATPQPLNLAEPVAAAEVFFDSTCLKANIHFPVDWVLLRDIARTLMKATVLIRREGLKQRMPQEPLRFLGDRNQADDGDECEPPPARREETPQAGAATNEGAGKKDRAPRPGAP